MSDQYVGEIRMVGFNFAPSQWALCNGQLLSISQNTALFSLLGTYYGGNGTSTFALPNLQAAAPMNQGNGAGLTPRVLGEAGGAYAVTLQSTQMAAHNHGVNCITGSGTSGSPLGAVWAQDGSGRTGISFYSPAVGSSPVMNPAALQITGNGHPHNNLQPFLAVYFVIALSGTYPTRG
jgi:microcystin-dependent protein